MVGTKQRHRLRDSRWLISIFIGEGLEAQRSWSSSQGRTSSKFSDISPRPGIEIRSAHFSLVLLLRLPPGAKKNRWGTLFHMVKSTKETQTKTKRKNRWFVDRWYLTLSQPWRSKRGETQVITSQIKVTAETRLKSRSDSLLGHAWRGCAKNEVEWTRKKKKERRKKVS